MLIRHAWCTGCDRNVRVVAPEDLTGDTPPADPSRLICLDYGELCTGDMCPLFQTPSDEMRERLERALAGEHVERRI